VKDVADVVQRTVSKAEGSTSEDDISRWLLGLPDANGEANLKETLTLQLEETQAHGRVPINGAGTETLADVAAAQADDSGEQLIGDAPVEEEGKSGWNFFKRGKAGPAKKKVGKLPPRPEQQSKDSREAAADILREMTRRR
jgi:hypothetical protein